MKKAFVPSFLAILTAQSSVFLYKTSALPDYIIILLLIVSKGYEITPAVPVMN